MTINSPNFWSRYLKSGLQAVFDTFKRFPLALLLFFGLGAIIIYRIEVPYKELKDISDILDRLSGVMALGIPLSLSIALLLEKLGKGKSISLKIGSSLAAAAVLYLYYLFLFSNTDMVPMTRLMLVTGSMILSFLFIPYLLKRDHFEVYITNVITRAATTAFYTIAMGLGLMAILFAVKSLLLSGMKSEIYAETWVLAWTVFAPLHFLYNLPNIDDSFTAEHFNKVIKIMLLYIALPIITIYTTVLYIYFGKIIITQVWPKGIVSYLVVSYTAAAIAVIFLISPFREQNKWVRGFTVTLTKLIFPLLGMMFISIGIRIGEFGFTENRYFILVIGLWATAIMVFLNFNKGKNNTVLPVSLAIAALLTVFGPWNAFEVSKMSQSSRFYEIASKYDMIQNGKVEKSSTPVETKDQQEISEILRYFDRSHELSDLKYLPANFTMKQMKDVFGFSEVYSRGMPNNYFSYYQERGLPVEISGYDVYFLLQTFKYDSGNQVYEKELSTGKGTVKLSISQDYLLTVRNNGIEIYRYDLVKYVQSLYDNYGSNIPTETKPGIAAPGQEKMTSTDENLNVNIKLIFYNINGSIDTDNEGLKIDNIDGEIFLGIK